WKLLVLIVAPPPRGVGVGAAVGVGVGRWVGAGVGVVVPPLGCGTGVLGTGVLGAGVLGMWLATSFGCGRRKIRPIRNRAAAMSRTSPPTMPMISPGEVRCTVTPWPGTGA